MPLTPAPHRDAAAAPAERAPAWLAKPLRLVKLYLLLGSISRHAQQRGSLLPGWISGVQSPVGGSPAGGPAAPGPNGLAPPRSPSTRSRARRPRPAAAAAAAAAGDEPRPFPALEPAPSARRELEARRGSCWWRTRR
eukprot:tig00021682_g23103.t1